MACITSYHFRLVPLQRDKLMMLVRVVAAWRGRRRRVRAEQGRRRRHGGRDGRRRRGRGTPVEVLLNRVGGLQKRHRRN